MRIPSGKIAAMSVAAACAAGGAFVVVHHQPARPATVVRSAAAAGPVSAVTSRPKPTVAAAGQRPAAAAAVNAKKGVAAWRFSGVRPSLRKSGVSWYYTWAPSHAGIRNPHGVKFVPMIWGPGSVTGANLAEARRHGRYLLGFNEPDLGSQSNMTVNEAIRLWPRLMATGMRLGSPAVSAGAATPGSWLARFMRRAQHRGYRVNFITLHWYGGDFRTGAAVGELKGYLKATWARYHKPIWLTEYALTNFGTNPATFPTWRQQAAFVTASTRMLERLRYVHRYAWFALPSDSTDGTVGLFRAGGVPTRAGRAFEAVDAGP
jgi:hypothetical protein